MTTTISPDQYCAHPEDYKNFPGIDDQTRAYWDQYCQVKKQISQQKLPDSQSLAWAVPEALKEFIMGIFSPMGMEMMGAFIGTPILYKYVIRNLTGSGIKLLLSESELALADKFITEGGSRYIANSCTLLNKIFGNIAYADLEVATKAGYSAGKYSVAKILESVGELFELINPVMDVLFVIQIIGMVFDAWDPCQLNVELDADQIHSFSNLYNTQFRNHVLVSLESTMNSYGHVSINTIWPLEYYAEKSALIPFKNDYYEPIKTKLFMKYVNSLRVNSEGDTIVHYNDGKLISNDDISQMQQSILSTFSNGNTVVENWLLNWWPIFIGVFILLLGIFLLVRK